MKSRKSDLRSLLGDVLPAADEFSGPTCAQVLGMVKQQRSRRRSVRIALTSSAVVILSVVLLNSQRPASKEVPVAIVQAPAPMVVREITDEQLATLLHDIPSALIEWPNGDRT
ncbi:MAG: hypothetical protein M3463_19390, partial [Verrucomicrobiota bacterium]|nr:hypothetical protein [Verrucomicrobiota bacterium]